MIEIINKVDREIKKLGLTRDEVINENIIKACTAKVAVKDNLKKEGIDFDELEEKIYPDSTFVNQMIFHLDNGQSGKEIISKFLLGAYYSARLHRYQE